MTTYTFCNFTISLSRYYLQYVFNNAGVPWILIATMGNKFNTFNAKFSERSPNLINLALYTLAFRIESVSE